MPRRHRPDTTGIRGFTLLEVLVALGVCGVFIAALAPAYTANATRARGAGGRLDLVNATRQLLEILPDRGDMSEGVLTGKTSGVEWRLESFALPVESDGERKPAWTPYRIVIDLTAANGATSHMETIRLGKDKGR